MVSALQKFSKYIFLEEQESSSLGATWRAAELAGSKIDHNLLTDVIAPGLANDPGFREQYLKQSSLSTKLEHPNILRKVSSNVESGELISFYEYQEGFSLEKVMKRCQAEMNPFSVDHALLVVSKLLSALAYAKTKHLTHGFVNPSMIFVTHEGEIKLKGYAFSSALRAAKSSPALNDYYRNYAPAGMSLTSEDRDRMDIYGCGAILYEMLVGEPYKGGSDVGRAIASVQTASEGEPIPPKIAAILTNSLGETYKDIQKMAKDMDELLFSGEYSPTTFNLAFFMHSAFRQEMEELGEKIAAEKGRDFGGQQAAPPPPKAAAAAPPPAPSAPPSQPAAAAPPPPRPAEAAKPQAAGKSKTPMLIGVVALIVVVIIAVVLMPKGDAPEDSSTISKIQNQLEQEGVKAEEDQARLKEEELERQNRELKELLREQAERELQRKEDELATEMAEVDKQIEEARRRKESEQKLQNLEAELQRMKMLQEAAAKKEAEKQKEEARQAVKPKPKSKAETQTAKAETNKPKTVEKPAPAKPEPTKPEPKPTEDASNIPTEAPQTLRMPSPGDLVLLSDEQLRRPELLQTVPQLKAPRKAVRDGVVKKGKPQYYIMNILINEKGEVNQAKMTRRSLPRTANDYGMEDMAREAAMKTKWSVPTKQGVPVQVWSFVTITFHAK